MRTTAAASMILAVALLVAACADSGATVTPWPTAWPTATTAFSPTPTEVEDYAEAACVKFEPPADTLGSVVAYMKVRRDHIARIPPPADLEAFRETQTRILDYYIELGEPGGRYPSPPYSLWAVRADPPLDLTGLPA